MDQPKQFGDLYDRFTIPGEAFDDCQADLLICSFSCGIESGQVGPLVISQLLHSLPCKTVARFDIDQVFDYRARRPRLEIDNWVVQGVQMPGCQLDLLTDYSGKRFLVLHGMEPDFSWGSFSDSLLAVIKQCGVKHAVDLQSAGSSIPHTRTQLINLFTSRKEDLPEGIAKGDRHLLSATFGFQLMFALSNLGVRTDSIMMTVPYYVADTQYPSGAVIALEFIADRMGLDVPVGDLEAAAQSVNQDIDSQVELSGEAQMIVREMEERYDALPPNTCMFTAKSLADSLSQAEGAQIADRIESFLEQVDRQRVAQEEDERDAKPKKTLRFAPELPAGPAIERPEEKDAISPEQPGQSMQLPFSASRDGGRKLPPKARPGAAPSDSKTTDQGGLAGLKPQVSRKRRRIHPGALGAGLVRGRHAKPAAETPQSGAAGQPNRAAAKPTKPGWSPNNTATSPASGIADSQRRVAKAERRRGNPDGRSKQPNPAADRKPGQPGIDRNEGGPATDRKATRPATERKATRPAAERKSARSSSRSSLRSYLFPSRKNRSQSHSKPTDGGLNGGYNGNPDGGH